MADLILARRCPGWRVLSRETEHGGAGAQHIGIEDAISEIGRRPPGSSCRVIARPGAGRGRGASDWGSQGAGRGWREGLQSPHWPPGRGRRRRFGWRSGCYVVRIYGCSFALAGTGRSVNTIIPEALGAAGNVLRGLNSALDRRSYYSTLCCDLLSTSKILEWGSCWDERRRSALVAQFG